MKGTRVALSVGTLDDFDFLDQVLIEVGCLRPLPMIEILWDNFCCTDPESLGEILSKYSRSVSLHIMWSKFLDRDERELLPILQRLKRFVKIIKPVSVSDHLCRFRIDGVPVIFAQEYDYQNIAHVCERVSKYQDIIGMEILLENAASTHFSAADQVEFIGSVMDRTGCGILFDVSNAVVGELNMLGRVSEWGELIAGKDLRCHVGSYGIHAPSGVVQDTHAHDVSEDTLDALAMVVKSANVVSVTYERDYEKSVLACSSDIRKIQLCVDR